MRKSTFLKHSRLLFAVIFIAVFFSFVNYMYFLSDIDIQTLSNTDRPLNFAVVIDPGHGGEDGGAVGVNGSVEKDINISISQKLYRFINVFTDVKCFMTRYTDKLLYKSGQENRKKFYDLKNRVEIINSYENPVVISIHQNKFPVSKYKGLQVYYSPNNKMSAIFAKNIQEKSKVYLSPENTREIKKAGNNIYLMKNLNCPAILIECGFLSNPHEEKLLLDKDYQRKIAFVVFSSFFESFSNKFYNSI